LIRFSGGVDQLFFISTNIKSMTFREILHEQGEITVMRRLARPKADFVTPETYPSAKNQKANTYIYSSVSTDQNNSLLTPHAVNPRAKSLPVSNNNQIV
jgi:hypothetical protein